jgi:glycosyltransferase involved in cell wall biosynthesis
MPDPLPVPPLFSVVIPTHRRNESLARCLDRLVAGAQTLPPDAYEVIVSDDFAGADNAQRLVQERYPGFRWVAGPGRGPAANRNRGAAEARASWLVFTDDDCVPMPGWLAAYAARLGQPDGPTLRVLEGATTAGGAKDYGPFMSVPLNEDGGCLWSCNFAIERTLFEEIGGFDDRFPYPHLEDVDLRLRLEDRGQAFPFVREAAVEHPPRPGRGVRLWAESQESAFYLAHKRGVAVSHIGPSVSLYLRIWLISIRACRNVREAVIVSVRWTAAVFLIACRWPFWKAKYRRSRTARAVE